MEPEDPAGTVPARSAATPGLGGRIRAARAAADLSRDELADRIGSSARTIRRLEDEQRRPRPSELLAIADATGAPEWFLQHGWRGLERTREGRHHR